MMKNTHNWVGYQIVKLMLLALLGFISTFAIPALSTQPSPGITEIIPQPANGQQLLQQGIELYEAERFSEAAEIWQQAAEAFAIQQDTLNQALVWSNLSLSYQHLGEWQKAETAIAQSFNLLQTKNLATNSQRYSEILAKAFNTQGRLQWEKGQLQEAKAAWEKAARYYAQSNNYQGVIHSFINQAKALQALGFSIASEQILKDVQNTIQQQSNTKLQVIALQSLGNAFRRVGNLEESQKVLNQSLAIANQELTHSASPKQQNSIQSSILLDLGNTKRAQWERAVALNLNDANNHKTAALEDYQNAATLATSTLSRVQANANLLSLLVTIKSVEKPATNQWDDIWTLWNTLQAQFAELPLSRSGIEVQINAINSLLKIQRIRESVEDGRGERPEVKKDHLDGDSTPTQLQPSDGQNLEILRNLAQRLTQTIQQARQLQDRRAESLALGQLGNVYEQARQWNDAKTVTNQAIILADAIQAFDVRYRWEWQLGRLLEKQGDTENAIRAYTAAVEALKSVRTDLLMIDSEVQFSFRDNVEPVYRSLVDLLLRSEGENGSNSDNLDKAVIAIDELQLAELQNFLRCDLRQKIGGSQPQNNETSVDIINQLDPEAALIYPIILPERVEVIFKLPGEDLKHYTTNVEKTEVEQTIQELRSTIIARTHPEEMQERASRIYDWIIRPLQTELSQKEQVHTLVFVLDGELRNIPLSVLYDGEKYLLEKDYAIALLPSLQIFNLENLQRGSLRVLAAGVSEARNIENHRFNPLKNVENELNNIRQEVSTEILLNSAFTELAFKEKIDSLDFSAVHIATHGKFSSDPNETFILAYDQLLKSQNLDNILRTENQDKSDYIDLLVLSACETAQGDNRATLGLAGIAVRAGALTTVSTLWQVKDQTTALLMQEFYKRVAKSDLTKAEALHQAQRSLFEKGYQSSPFIWSPYVLIGNWL